MDTQHITWSDFEQVDLRVGTITRAETFPEAKRPAYKLWVDLGPELGLKKSSAQITDHYTPEALIGKQVLCVCNFPAKQIGPIQSEVLVTGIATDNGVVLVTSDQVVPNGSRLT